MKRWWVIPRNKFFNIYLHEVGQDDEDRALHDHPWWNMSWVLAGGFTEVTNEGRVDRLPGAVKIRRPTDAHRLELIDTYNVSLFITGPKVRKWGFLCPKGWVPYEEFVGPFVKVDGVMTNNVGKGCGEDDGDGQVR